MPRTRGTPRRLRRSRSTLGQRPRQPPERSEKRIVRTPGISGIRMSPPQHRPSERSHAAQPATGQLLPERASGSQIPCPYCPIWKRVMTVRVGPGSNPDRRISPVRTGELSVRGRSRTNSDYRAKTRQSVPEPESRPFFDMAADIADYGRRHPVGHKVAKSRPGQGF